MLLTIHVTPGAKSNQVIGWQGKTLKIKIAAPPVDSKANEALIDFLAARLGLKRYEITLESGRASRDKRVRIPLAEEDVLAAFTSDSR